MFTILVIVWFVKKVDITEEGLNKTIIDPLENIRYLPVVEMTDLPNPAFYDFIITEL